MLAMSTPTALDRFELERFVQIAETSVKINRRHQFFSWVQGPLQGLLPHHALCCVLGKIKRFRIDHFADEPVPPEEWSLLAEHDDGALWRALREWEHLGQKPLILGAATGNDDQSLARVAWPSSLGHALVHGTSGSFFCFYRLDGEVQTRQRYLVELLTPYLHSAFARIADDRDSKAAAPPPAALLLSRREREILQWIHHGKSNIEIGIILGVSEFTVKRHVQNLLRKLNVPNRAQAVAKGLALQITRSE